MTEKQLSDIEDIEIQRLRDSRPVILLGSLVSTYSPTNLPSGEQIVEYVFTILFPKNFASAQRPWPSWLKRDYKSLPFEGIWSCHPRPDVVAKAIVSLYSRADAKANAFHDKIAHCLKDGAISGVVTTNYDLAVERSIHASGIHVIERKEESSKASGAYFKIHGSAKTELEILKDGIICRLEQEGRLPEWKKSLLAKMLRNRSLLVIGYSGRDFDICREIAGMNALGGVHWLELPGKTVSRNAREVLNAKGGTLIRGDFSNFLSRFFMQDFGNIRRAPFLSEGDLFGPQYYPEWRIRILERLRCYNLCRPLLDNESDLVQNKLFDVYVDLLSDRGKYGMAAKASMRQSNRHSHGSLEWISHRIAASGSRLGQGKHLRAGWQYLHASWMLGRHMHTDVTQRQKLRIVIQVLRQKLTFVMRAGQFGLLRRPAVRDLVVRRFVSKAYKRAQRLGALVGTLDDLQWIQLNAERLGFGQHNSQATPSLEGLGNLGLLGSSLIPQRDIIRDGSWEITGKDLKRARLGIITAVRYGLLHEKWKFSWLLAWRGPESCRKRHLVDWLAGFCGTEYGLVYRFLVLYSALGPRNGRKGYCAVKAVYGMLVWSSTKLGARPSFGLRCADSSI